MKKFIKKSVVLLMAGAMVVLPVTMSVQAKVVSNDTKIVNAVTKKAYGNATITGNGVRIRKTPSTSATILGMLYKGDRVKTGTFCHWDGRDWVYCVTESGIAGYVTTDYIKKD